MSTGWERHRQLDADVTLQESVLQALRADGRLKASDVGVGVHGGVVTLVGAVGTYAERLAAKEAAHRVHGVLDVANDLQVVPVGSAIRSDTAIAHAVRHALEWDALVPHERIHTTVTAGWVMLEGTVDQWFERERAEKAVEALVGVRGVNNRIDVGCGDADVATVRLAIETALARRADREAQHLDVTVKDGIVTVEGIVASAPEREAVVGAARHARGVRELHDLVRVEPS